MIKLFYIPDYTNLRKPHGIVFSLTKRCTYPVKIIVSHPYSGVLQLQIKAVINPITHCQSTSQPE